MDTSPALRCRFNSGFHVYTREPWSRGIPVALKNGSTRHVYWGGFVDVEQARKLRPVKLAIMAYAQCDVLRQWNYLSPSHYAAGCLGNIDGHPRAFAVIQDNAPIIRLNPHGPLVTDPDSPLQNPGF